MPLLPGVADEPPDQRVWSGFTDQRVWLGLADQRVWCGAIATTAAGRASDPPSEITRLDAAGSSALNPTIPMVTSCWRIERIPAHRPVAMTTLSVKRVV